MSSPTVSAIVLLSFGGFALAFTGTFYRLGLAFSLWWFRAFRPLWPGYYDKMIELVENRSFGFWYIRPWGVLAVVIGGSILYTGGW